MTMEKGNFHRLSLLAAISGVAVLTMGVVSLVNQTTLAKAGNVETKTCNYISFGTTEYSSTSTVDSGDYTLTGTGLQNLAVSVSTYCYAVSGSAARIGKSSTAGTLTFTFDSVKITSIGIDGFIYGTDSSKTAAVTASTSANSTGFTLSCSSTTSAHYSDNGVFASDAASTTLTIKSTSAARFDLVKITVETSSTTVVPDSSVSSSSSSSSSPSSSSSSKAKVLSSISASGMTTTSYTAGQALDTSGLVVTASYDDGTSSAVTGYTTDPLNGATLTTSNTAMAISYTESGVAKTTSVPLTVTAASKTLMVRFKEILSGTYCDSILIKYGDWECLIDGGNSSDKATVSSALSTYCTDQILDMYIASHPHSDHIGIFDSDSTDVFGTAGIGTVSTWVDCGGTNTSANYTNYAARRTAWVAKGTNYIPALAFFTSTSGYTSAYGNPLYTTSDGVVSLRFLNTSCYPTPETSVASDPNEHSVACVLSAWNQRYIFSGDGDSTTESGIKSNNSDSNNNPLYWSSSNDVYMKANHHGSDTNGSNSSDYLSWVNPDHIMISAAIISKNQTSSGVISEQHPYVAAVARMEAVTYDIHWNGINGTFAYSSLGGATPVFTGTAKEISYYYNGSVVTGEETTTFPMSKWCLSSTYSSVAKTAPTRHDLYRGSFVGSFLNASFRYDSLDSFASSAPAVNANGDLYDSLTDSYC